MDVEGGVAECGDGIAEDSAFGGRVGALDHLALAGHHGFTGAIVPPACRERKVFAGHVAIFAGGGDGDGGDLSPQRTRGDAGNGRIGVEQVG